MNNEDVIAKNYFVYNNCESPNEPENGKCFKGGISRPHGVCHSSDITISAQPTIIISTKTRSDYV